MAKNTDRAEPTVPGSPMPTCGADLGSEKRVEAAGARPATPEAKETQRETPGIVDQAREQAGSLGSEAKHTTAEVAGHARERVGSLVGEQRERAADRLDALAGVVRDAAQRLGNDQVGGEFGRYAARAADEVESMSSYVRRTDVQTFLRDTRQFARRRPELFVGATFATGLLLARFLKATSPEEPRAEPVSWEGR